MKSLGLLIYLIFIGLNVKAGISFVVDEIEDGGKLNATILFDPPLTEGEVFNFYVDNKWAAKLEVINKDEISSMKLRFRSQSNPGEAYLTIKRSNDEVDSISHSFRNMNPYLPQISTINEKKDVDLRQKLTSEKLMILAKSDMTVNNYISRFDINTDNGKIKFHLSPNISKDPFIVLRGSFSTAVAKNAVVKSSFNESYLSKPKKTISEKKNIPTIDIIETLKELDSLLENQLITKEEFENLKNDLLK